MKKWTHDNIPDLTDKVIIVTGANSGIGYEAAQEFGRKGAQTIMACRSMDKAQVALNQIRAEVPDARNEIMQLDLASLESVRKFANQFISAYDRLDILLNNAGIMMVPYGLTEDGFERQLGTNHLGHFALTGRLFELISSTPSARIVNVSSNGHRFGAMDFDNLLFDEGIGYSPTQAYGRSKLANLLFTYELQRIFEAGGIDAMALGAHPGMSNTNLAVHLYDRWYFKPFVPLAERIIQSAAMGALPSLRAAVDLDGKGGQYFGPGGFREYGGYPVLVESSEAAHNEADARRLWEMSEALTGVKFGY